MFGEKNTPRFRTEEFRIMDIQLNDLFLRMKRTMINYFWYNVFDKEYKDKIEKEYEN